MLGYVDRWSVQPGGRITVKASSAGGVAFQSRIARILCGDPNPRGPGYREIAMPHATDGTHPGLEQGTHLGSWGRVPFLDLSGTGGAFVAMMTIWPTTPAKGLQGLFAWVGTDGAALSLALSPEGVVASVTMPSRTARAATGKPLLERAWYDVWLAVDVAKGTLRLSPAPLEPHPGFRDAGAASATPAR